MNFGDARLPPRFWDKVSPEPQVPSLSRGQTSSAEGPQRPREGENAMSKHLMKAIAWSVVALIAVMYLCLNTGCEVVDILDGDIEDPDTCCIYYPWEDKIVECVESFLPPDPNACVPVRCLTVEGTVCYGDSSRY